MVEATTFPSRDGSYLFEVRIIYCDSGSPLCAHGWVETKIQWTVTVASNQCTISAIPYMMQNDPRWGGNEYAGPVPHDNIATWGCAITSSAMVLRRYGANYGIDNQLVNPGTLNAWLAANQGYQGKDNDILYWPKVESYSTPYPGGSGMIPRVVYQGSEAVNFADNTPCTYVKNDTGTGLCSTYNQKIDNALCAGKPPILRVKSLTRRNGKHFLVVDGQETVAGTGETVSILDPSSETRLTLLPYSNRYTGYRFFSAVTESTDPTSIVVYLGSPAHLLMTDANGNRTGWDPATGEIVAGIPKSNYLDEGIEDQESWTLYVDGPVAGPYELRVVGTGEGQFSVGVVTRDRTWETQSKIFEGTISTGRTYTYSVAYSPEPGGATTVKPSTYLFEGFGPPLAADVVKVFKLDRTLPVKFTITRWDGGPHGDIVARLTFRHVDNGVPAGDPIEPTTSGSSNNDGLFRYDPIEDQYIYNLSTGSLGVGTWQLLVHLDDGSVETVRFGLK